MSRLVIILFLAGTLHGTEVFSLREAVNRVTSDSPSAKIALARIQAAESALMQATAAFQPQVTVQSGYVVTNQPVNVFGMALNQRAFTSSLNFNDVPTGDNWSTGVMVSMPLYSGGRNLAGREAATSALEAYKVSAQAVQQVLANQVTQTWLGILKTREFIAAAKASVAAYESNLALATKRNEAGTALKTDALDIEVRLAVAREDLARAENANQLMRQALSNLLGIESGNVDAANEASPLDIPPADTQPKRAELLAAEKFADVARARAKQASAGRKPTVNAFASAEHNRGAQFDGHCSNFTAGIMAQWNVWDGGLTRGRQLEADAHLRAALEEVRRQQLAIALEIKQARTALSEATRRLEVSTKSITLAEESVKLTRERFQTGLALASQLIDAESALTGARMRRAEAESNRLAAIAALRHALGLQIVTK
ncbi:MAG: TolC family protein [Verrucomicrobiaceae bacterium]|nr:TolC family protein [Verrucomicrobiaceae bacterium]